MARDMAPVRAQVLLASLAVAAAPALAGDDRPPWQAGAGVEVTHDDNVFRAPPGSEQADTSQTVFVTGGLNLRLGRQRLAADLTLRRSHFAEHAELDNTGYGGSVAWDGSTAGDWSWRVSGAASRTLVSYAAVVDAAQRVPDLQSSREFDARVQLGGAARWVATAEIGWRGIDHSADAFAASNYESTSFGASATWQPLGPLSVTVRPRWTHGRYPDGAAPLAFDRTDVDLSAAWQASGASTLTARLSATHQRYTEGVERDFSGLTGQLNWAWVPTGRLRIDTFASRDTGAETSFFALGNTDRALRVGSDDSRLTTTLNIAATHAVTGKLSLAVGLQQVQRRLSARSRIAGGPALAGAEGSETTHGASLTLRYAPTHRSSIDCSLGRQQRGTDTALSSPFRATTMGCSARISIGV